jgi:hypothetical protein
MWSNELIRCYDPGGNLDALRFLEVSASHLDGGVD